MAVKDTINNASSCWMGDGPEADVVISSRIRVARNLVNFPFPHLLTPDKGGEIINLVERAIEKESLKEKIGFLELIRLGELVLLERKILVEKHLISPDILKDYQKAAVVLRNDEVISLMVNEEDHLRIQCLLPGLQMHEAWKLVDCLDGELEKTLPYAFDEKLGYLTTCPTNVGTGMRASLMVHLPGLVMVNQIKDVVTNVTKLGLTVRGLYGEGTEAYGNLFQLSNQVTLGKSEEDIITNLIFITRQIINQERIARQALFKERREQLEDRVGRAYGILKHAHVISSAEALRLLSDLRLGIVMQIIKNIPACLVMELILLTRPVFLVKITGKEMSSFIRDVYRAKLIRERLFLAEKI
ncbi:MAG: protein arginine kinase [Peptococcaceae bacterium]